MRSSPLFASFAVAALVGACHNPPAEQVADRDAATAAATPALSTFIHPEGGPAATSAGHEGGTSPAAAFCADVFAADSGQLLQKCLAKDLSFTRGLARAASNLCNDDMAAVIARARTTFDQDAARHCVEMLSKTDRPRAGLSDTLFAHYPCDRVVLGTSKAGEACRFSVECGEGLACEGYAVGSDGVCQAPPKVGEACKSQRFGSILNDAAAELHHPACVTGAWCDGTTCQARIPAGKACPSTTSCAAGLSCVMGKCGPLAANGAGCYGTNECGADSWCNRPPLASAGRCEPKRPAGAECPVIDACRGRCDMPKHPDGGALVVGKCVEVCGSG